MASNHSVKQAYLNRLSALSISLTPICELRLAFSKGSRTCSLPGGVGGAFGVHLERDRVRRQALEAERAVRPGPALEDMVDATVALPGLQLRGQPLSVRRAEDPPGQDGGAIETHLDELAGKTIGARGRGEARLVHEQRVRTSRRKREGELPGAGTCHLFFETRAVDKYRSV